MLAVCLCGNGDCAIPITTPLRPAETDFETQVLASGVNIFFSPSQSHYTFIRLSDEGHVSRSAPLSHDASVRRPGPSGDTGECDPAEVLEIAYQVASKAAKRRVRQR